MYRKNTAGQFVSFQLLLTATGAVATGLAPTARRCIDGTWAAGTGTFTEDGATGAYKYAMSQADTNGNNIAIVASATGAMPVVVNLVTTAADPTNAATFGITNVDAAISSRMATYVQPAGFLGATFPSTLASPTNITSITGNITGNLSGSVGSVTGLTASDVGAIKTKTDQFAFTIANQVDSNTTAWKGVTAPANTGDAFARLGVPTGASTAVDIAAIKSVLPAALVGGRIDASLGAVAAGAIAATSFAANALDAVWSTAVRVLTAGTNIALAKGTGLTGLNDLAGSDVRAAVGMGSANLDTQLNTISLQIPSANTVADALLDRTDGIETSFSLRASTRLMLSAFVGRISGGGTTAETVRDINNTKNRIVYTVDANGNRTNVAVDVS